MKEQWIPYKVDGKRLIYEMPQEVDHHVASRLCKELDMLVEANQIKELELDFSKTEFMDSSGIGVIIGRCKTMRFLGGSMAVIHLQKRVAKIFQTAGLYKIVEVKES